VLVTDAASVTGSALDVERMPLRAARSDGGG
jgi:hypothetical protein